MTKTVAQLMPFIVAGAFVPTWTSYVIILLGTERPIGNAGGYVAGNATWRLLLGFVAIFVTSVAAPEANNTELVIPIWFALMVAAVLVGIGVYLIRKQPQSDTGGQELPKWLQSVRRLPPWASYSYGAFGCALPGVQWVYFLGACAVIATSGLGLPEQFVLLLVVVAVLEVMLVTPIGIYARNRESATAKFDSINHWLGRHTTTVFGIILSALGALFLLIALNGGRVG